MARSGNSCIDGRFFPQKNKLKYFCKKSTFFQKIKKKRLKEIKKKKKVVSHIRTPLKSENFSLNSALLNQSLHFGG